MKYVKIKAGTYNDAMMKLRMEYGEDAIPVSHKYVKEGGILNSKLFAKNLVELSAAIPEKNSTKMKPAKRTVDYTVGDNDPLKEALKNISMEKLQNTAVAPARERGMDTSLAVEPPRRRDSFEGHLRDTIRNKAIPPEPPAALSLEKESLPDYNKFVKEFEEIKSALKTLIGEGNIKKGIMSGDLNSADDEIVKPYVNILKDNEFDYDERTFLIEEVRKSISPEDMKDRYKIEKTLKDLLKSRIITSGPIKKGTKKKVIMFVGPTGVGKTTTMAKLGAIYALREDYRVSFVTIDTYRIAATEQLKKYAGIMKIPIHVVNDQKSFKEVINNEKSEIILVDTSGRSHKNELKISEIKSYADQVECDLEKILCVCANTKKNDLKDIFKAFGKLNFTSVIVTKVDESSYIGSVIDVLDKFKKPMSYYTNGQEVPNDIFVADPNKIVEMIIGQTTYAGG